MPKTPRRARPIGRPVRLSHNGLLYPLDIGYAQAGVALPKVETVAPDDIPLPYRSLLVHDRDMTPTLEQHYGGRVILRTLSTFARAPWYARRVLLADERSGRPFEMGAICVKLDALTRRVQADITRNDVPLGRILREAGVEYERRSPVFLAVTPNSEMMGVFWMRRTQTLYGRRTEIVQGTVKIGDIVEILPPAREE